jgi:SAM-dependent methyltransferase
MEGKRVHKPCVACGEWPDRPLLHVAKKGLLQVVKCPSCGLVYSDVDLRPDRVLQDDAPYFPYDVYATEPQIYREEAQRYLDAVQRFKKSGLLLDIGCGFGYFLATAREQGWQVKGIDISPVAIREAQRNFGLEDVQAVTVAEADFSPSSFDVITIWNCLEHMAHPATTLTRVVEWLKPDGLLALEVPDHDGLLFSINLALHKMTRGRLGISKQLYGQGEGSHLYIFTAQSLERMFARWGFQARYLERTNSPAKTLLSTHSLNKNLLKALGSYTALYLGYGLATLIRRQNRLLMIFSR